MSVYRSNAEDPDERIRLIRRNHALERWFRIFRASLWPVRAWKQLRAWYAKQQVQLRTHALPSALPAPVPPPPPRQPKVVFSRYYNRVIDTVIVDGQPVFELQLPEDAPTHGLPTACTRDGIDEVVIVLWDSKAPLLAIRPSYSGPDYMSFASVDAWYYATTGERIYDKSEISAIAYAREMRWTFANAKDGAALRDWKRQQFIQYQASRLEV